jgi:hypothetical protein
LEEERKKQFDDTPFPTFLEVLDKVGKSAYFWPSVGAEGEGGVEAHTRGVFEELTKTPYLAKCLQPHLDAARQILDRDIDAYQPTLQDLRVLKMFDDAVSSDENKRDKLKKLYLENQQQHLKPVIKNHCLEIIHQVRMKTYQVQTQLQVLSGLARQYRTRDETESESESSTTSTSCPSTATSTSTEVDDDDGVAAGWAARSHLRFADITSIYSSIFRNAKDIDQVLPNICSCSSSNAAADQTPRNNTKAPAHDDKNSLARVAKTLETFLSTAQVVVVVNKTKNGQVDGDQDKILDGLTVLRREFRFQQQQQQEGPDDGDDSNEASSTAVAAASAASATAPSDCGGSSNSVHNSMVNHRFMPGPQSHHHERTVIGTIQPFVQLLLQAIGECCWNHPDNSDAWSSSRSSPVTAENRPRRRIVDLLLQKDGRCDDIIFDDNLTLPLVVKPAFRRETKKWLSKGPMALLDEAREHVVSHLAKRLFVGFGFTGYGVPCHATGIVANMAAVQVYQLRYENVGSPEAKLVLYQTKLAPLMSRKNFKRWTGSIRKMKKRKELDKLEEDLYGKEDTQRGVDDEIPKGIRILFNLMNQPSNKLQGISVETSSERVLGDQLGTGASSVVFRRPGTENVIKISRYGIKRDIDNELDILKKLAIGSEKCTNEHVPSIIDSRDIQDGILPIKLGSVTTKMRAIETTPVGKHVASVVLPTDIDTTPDKGLRLVLVGIKSALDYMHSKRICHCDVTPRTLSLLARPTETVHNEQF